MEQVMPETDNGEPSNGNCPPVPAVGCGPNAGGRFSQTDYHHPAAAWGAAKSVGLTLVRQGEIIDGVRAVFRMNHEDGGFDCPGCAWPDDRKGLRMDICENGIKHVTWEMTKKRVTNEFFAAHTVTELITWSDFALENEGRLTEPMAYNAATDRYEPVSWDDAFALIGRTLRSLPSPHQASFYTSGRLSNEATFLYQLFAREFGTNNLPDCSSLYDLAAMPRGSESVLVVEGDIGVRTLCQRVLKESGYTVLEARDGIEAMQVAEQCEGHIELLVTDVVLPGMSGREVAERLVQLHPEMKVLFLSGFPDEVVLRDRILEAERALLRKPFSPASLVANVREVLDGA
jgi:CheY-like chemotaxis protein